jgi:glutamine synthetase
MGLTEPLPTSLEEALKELESDFDWATRVLGQEYVEWYIALKKAEIQTLSKMGAKERRLLLLDTF